MFYGSDVWQTKQVCVSAEDPPSCDSPPRPAKFSQSTLLLDLGVVPLGTTGTAVLTFDNDGDDYGRPDISPSDGLTVSGCSDDVPPQGSCVATIRFAPTTVGPFVGKLTVTATADHPLGAFVLARVTSQPVKVSPEELSVGLLALGALAPAQTITVTATDDLTDLTVTPVGAGIALDATATTCGSTLPRGATCLVVVEQTAVALGVVDAHVDLRAQPGGEALRVPVVGRVVGSSKLSTEPASLPELTGEIGNTRPAVDLDVIYPGDPAHTTLAIELSGANASDFRLGKEDCLSGSPVGVCTVSVSFRPFGSAGTRSATLNVTSSSAGATAETVTVPLTGTAFATGPLVIDSIVGGDLGAVAVGTTGPSAQVLVHNSGDTPLGPLTVSLANPELSLEKDECSGAVVEGGWKYCTLWVALRPTSSGRKTGALWVEGPGGEKAARTLTGVGVAAGEPLVNPRVVDLGDVLVGEMSPGKRIIVQNLSGTSLDSFSPAYVQGSSFSPFYGTASGCPTALLPGAACALTAYLVARGNGRVSRDVSIVRNSATWRTITVTGTDRWR